MFDSPIKGLEVSSQQELNWSSIDEITALKGTWDSIEQSDMLQLQHAYIDLNNYSIGNNK